MKRATKIVATVCIFSTFLMGCYTSVMLEPIEKEKMHIGEITSVVTKDSTKYEFDRAPVILDDKIVGEATITDAEGFVKKPRLQVSIPISDFAEFSVSRYSLLLSVLATGAVIVVAFLVMHHNAPNVLWPS